jgi:hypothetical protein
MGGGGVMVSWFGTWHTALPLVIILTVPFPLSPVPQLLPLVMALSEDKSWRVRWSVASKLDELCGAFGKEAVNGAIIFALEKLLKVRRNHGS